MSDEILQQILSNQQDALKERTNQGLMIAEIRTVLLGTKEPETPGLVQNFNTMRDNYGSRLNRLEKGMVAFLGLGGVGGGTTAYWGTIKSMLGLHS